MDILLVLAVVAGVVYLGKGGAALGAVKRWLVTDRKLTLVLGGLLLLWLLPGLAVELILPVAAVLGIWYMARRAAS